MRKLRLALPLALAVLTMDCTTKDLAEQHLTPGVSREVVGDVLQFTLVYNEGAAMGISLGPYARPILLVMGLGVMLILGHMLWRSEPGHRMQRLALGLLLGGALGNYINRLFSPLGVVDFINVGIGVNRFWIFNIADVAVCCGGALLAIALFRADRGESSAALQP